MNDIASILVGDWGMLPLDEDPMKTASYLKVVLVFCKTANCWET